MDISTIIFGVNCLGCGTTGKYLCNKCLALLPEIFQVCPDCRKYSKYGYTHKMCDKHVFLDGLVSAYYYRGIIRKAVSQIKYRFSYKVGDEIAGLVVDYLQNRKTCIPKSAVLIPIPSFNKRKRWRGFNQTEVIGKKIAEILKIGYSDQLIYKTKNTLPQVGLERKKRLTNISSSFAINEKIRIKANNIILFDDVVTTGATLNEAARIIKESYKVKMWGLTVARS